MSNTTLTGEEKRCLQMWFRHAIAEVERKEALRNIAAFYGGESKPRNVHHTPVARRTTRRVHSAHTKELV